MSVKAVRVLAVIAFALFATAFLLTGLGTLLQAPLKRLWDVSPEVVAYRTVPVPALVNGLVLFGLSLWHMLSALRCRSRRSSRIQVIVLTVLLLVWTVLFNPLISYSCTFLQAHYLGAAAIAAYSALTSALTVFLTPLSTTAYVLMILSMGAFFGRGGAENQDSENASDS